MYYEQTTTKILLTTQVVSWCVMRGSPRSVVRPTPLVRTERLGLLRRLEPARSTFEACSRNLSNSWDSKPNCSLWLRHFSSRSRTFDYTGATDREDTYSKNTAFSNLLKWENPPLNTIYQHVMSKCKLSGITV